MSQVAYITRMTPARYANYTSIHFPNVTNTLPDFHQRITRPALMGISVLQYVTLPQWSHCTRCRPYSLYSHHIHKVFSPCQGPAT